MFSFKSSFTLWAVVGVVATGHADILVNQDPTTGPYGGAWLNKEHTQIFADSVQFATATTINGFDYFSTIADPGSTWTLRLHANSATDLPGAILQGVNLSPSSWAYYGLYGVNVWVGTFSFAPIPLAANTKYWVGLSAVGFDGAMVTTQPSRNGDGALAQRQFDGEWERTDLIGDMTYRLRGTVVPEPMSLAVVGVCLASVVRRRRAAACAA